MEALVNGQVMAQELWACNRDTSRDWQGPDFRMNEMINTHPEREALIAFLQDSNRSGTEEDFDVFKNSFLGMWSSVEECVEEYLEAMGALAEIPALFRNYIAFDRLAYELMLTAIYTIPTENGDRWVFLY